MNEAQPGGKLTRQAVRQLDAAALDTIADGEIGPLARRIAEQYRRDSLSPIFVTGVLRLTEFVLLLVAGLVIQTLYLGYGNGVDWFYAGASAAGAVMAVFLLELMDGYQIPYLRRSLANMSRTLLAWAGSLAIIALAGFFLKVSGEFSRVWFAGWLISGAGILIVSRIVTGILVRRWGRNGRMERRAVIVGGGERAERLIRSIENDSGNDIRICGIFDDRGGDRSPDLIAGYPKLGTVSALVEFARVAHIDMLIVSLPLSAQERVLQMLKKLWVLPVDIRLSAHSSELRFRPRAYSYVGSVPMLDIFDRPINGWDSVAKRTFDIVMSLTGIIVFSPIMLATAIAIKLDSKGPVLFKQKRYGFNNEMIEVYKFRSMYVDQADASANKLVTKGDPRVTRVGRFIRKTSIDELPQFFNALKGNLSLVGPRPHAALAKVHTRLYHEVVDGYFARHRVKPGVTGWAQINGWRGETDIDEKIMKRTEYDLEYIENWSLWLDLKILLLTPIRLLKTENAY